MSQLESEMRDVKRRLDPLERTSEKVDEIFRLVTKAAERLAKAWRWTLRTLLSVLGVSLAGLAYRLLETWLR